MTKFKIGDTIYYMSNNKPESKTVTGTAVLEGKVEVATYSPVNQKEGSNVVYFADYTAVKEGDAYGSLRALQESVFGVEPDKKA